MPDLYRRHRRLIRKGPVIMRVERLGPGRYNLKIVDERGLDRAPELPANPTMGRKLRASFRRGKACFASTYRRRGSDGRAFVEWERPGRKGTYGIARGLMLFRVVGWKGAL